MKTIDQCYTCGDDLGHSPYFATFEGITRNICRDCAEGIAKGSEILRQNGVHGEYLDQTRNKNKP